MIPYFLLHQQDGLLMTVTIIAWIVAALALLWTIIVPILTALDPDSDPEYNRNSLVGAGITFIVALVFGLFGWIAVVVTIVGFAVFILFTLKDLFSNI